MKETEWIGYEREHGCHFELWDSSFGEGACITETWPYIEEEGWDDPKEIYSDQPMTIPDSIDGCSIVEIGPKAFERAAFIEHLCLPDSIRQVGKDAFAGCRFSIQRLPAELRIVEEGAFWGIKFIEDDLPARLEVIGDAAFRNCAGLRHLRLPEGLEMIGDTAFGCCPDLVSVSLQKSLTVVGEGIFGGCAGLRHIELAEGQEALSLIDGALIRNEDQTLIAWVPCDTSGVLRIPDGVRRIGAFALSYRTDIVSVAIPDSVVEIGQCAFIGCASLTQMALPDSVQVIGWSAFEGCTSLRDIRFGNGLTSIDAEAFKGCASLTQVSLPDSVVELGKFAFACCAALKAVSVSSKLEFIADSTFDGCALSAFDIRGKRTPSDASLEALVNGSLRCAAESYAMLKDIPYHFTGDDG